MMVAIALTLAQINRYNERNKVKMKTKVINLFGEPSAGKSTAAMDITAKLKRAGINAEYVSEFAKDKLYEKNPEVFECQEYIFGKQSFKMNRVRGKVQVIVVDSPLLMSIIYNGSNYLGQPFEEVVLNTFNSYDNKNYLLVRKHNYEESGRFQNETQASDIRDTLILELIKLDILYTITTSSPEDCDRIVNEIVKELRDEQ